MLQLETVEPQTFAVLKQLMANPEISGFHLVGGTALSLFYGDRIYEDLDLFSTTKFDNVEVSNVLT